ncbi:MAG: helix-turn-helix domain-containing protein [Chlorobium sp.]|nr:helix-turn-helix domain-containing protein [Chlorobium sp.]
MSDKKLFTATEAAKELSVHKRTLVTWLKEGRIPAFKIGFRTRKDWRIEYDVIMNIKKTNTNGYKP